MSAPRPNTFAGFVFGLLFGFFSISRLRPPRPLDDPEILLAQAQEEMREARDRNRERAVQAIWQKNNLQSLVEQTEKTVANLQKKAEYARRQRDLKLAEMLLAEQAQYETMLAQMQMSRDKAIGTVETIKAAMRDEEKRIQAKTVLALAMKAQWNQVQVENSIREAIAGLDRNDVRSLFRRAQARLTQERERQKQLALLEQVRQTSENLSKEAAQARENGDTALAGRLSAERDALLKLLPHRPS